MNFISWTSKRLLLQMTLETFKTILYKAVKVRLNINCRCSNRGCVIWFLNFYRLTVVSFVIKAATNECVFWNLTNQRRPFTKSNSNRNFFCRKFEINFDRLNFRAISQFEQREIVQEDYGNILKLNKKFWYQCGKLEVFQGQFKQVPKSWRLH